MVRISASTPASIFVPAVILAAYSVSIKDCKLVEIFFSILTTAGNVVNVKASTLVAIFKSRFISAVYSVRIND